MIIAMLVGISILLGRETHTITWYGIEQSCHSQGLLVHRNPERLWAHQ